MKSPNKLKSLRSFAFFCLLLSHDAFSAQVQDFDVGAISAAAGVTATPAADDVIRIGWARTDVPLSVDGVSLKPFAGLGSWAAFKESGRGVMMMGDTVVFQDEVNVAMDAAFAAGLEVTGLHNHFLFDEPKVYFMHIGGHGEAVDLAKGVKSVWDAIKAVRAKQPIPAKVFSQQSVEAGTLNQASLEEVIGSKAEVKDGVVKFTIGKKGMMHGTEVGASMGLSTWIAFSGNDKTAAISGDFIMTAAEVQTVLKSLRSSGINVVAIHNHMIGEQPAFYFTHFWAKGPTAELAKGFKAALGAQAALR
jgi:hypothetical protein